MHPNFFGIALRAPFPAGILEVAYKFLPCLSGLRRHPPAVGDEIHFMWFAGTRFCGCVRQPDRQGSFFFVSTDITGCCSASARLTLALMWANCASRSGWLSPSRVLLSPAARSLAFEQFAHHGVADFMPDRAQFAGQAAQAFAGPAQRRHRIATLTGLTSASKSSNSAGSVAVSALRPPPARRLRSAGTSEAPASSRKPRHRAGGDAGGAGNGGDPAIPGRTRLRSGKRATAPLIKKRPKSHKAITDGAGIDHRHTLRKRSRDQGIPRLPVKSHPKLTPFSRPNPTPVEVSDQLFRVDGRRAGSSRGSWSARRECGGQSLPKPRGGSMAWSSERSSSQIACNASAVAPSCRLVGIALSQATH